MMLYVFLGWENRSFVLLFSSLLLFWFLVNFFTLFVFIFFLLLCYFELKQKALHWFSSFVRVATTVVVVWVYKVYIFLVFFLVMVWWCVPFVLVRKMLCRPINKGRRRKKRHIHSEKPTKFLLCKVVLVVVVVCCCVVRFGTGTSTKRWTITVVFCRCRITEQEQHKKIQ